MASSSSGPTKIAVWHGYQDTEGDVFKGLIDQYNKDHPDVKVTELVLQQRPGAAEGADRGARRQRARRRLHVRVVVAEHRQDPAGRRHGQATSSKPDWNWDDFYPAEREAATVGDKVVGVPALVDNLAIVYNKKLFAEAGIAPPTPELDLGRLPGGGRQADRPVEGAVRLARSPPTAARTPSGTTLPMLWEAGGDILTPDNQQGGVQLRRRVSRR